jgi:hypothetical protein
MAVMRLWGTLAGLALLGACTGPAAGTVERASCDPLRGPPVAPFANVTDASGVTFQYATPDNKAGGLAVADLDGDGLADLVASRRIGEVVVYRNLGGMRFEAVPGSGLDPTAAINAILAADLDNDGDLDLVLAGTGFADVMANRGDGTFTRAASFASSGTTEQILAVDLDGDGLLDLYFSNYDLDHLAATQNRLYMNRGGLAFAAATGATGGGLTWTTTAFDFDGDGDQDLYVANDTLLGDFGRPVATEPTTSNLEPDLLLRNDGMAPDGSPRFSNLAATAGMDTPRSSMGGTLGDFDGDGRLDVFVPNEGANKLFVGDAATGFTEAAEALGVAAPQRRNATCDPTTEDEDCLLLSWSAALSDFDLDGYDELLLVNGSTAHGTPPPVEMFARGAAATFHEVSPDLACVDARGLVVTDLDGDGDQDVVISQREGPLLLYETVAHPAPGTWLRVTLRGRASNREGRGAVVIAHMASGRAQLRAVGTGGVINTSLPAEAFFGVGDDAVEMLEVRWPSGRRSLVPGPVAGDVVVDEGAP